MINENCRKLKWTVSFQCCLCSLIQYCVLLFVEFISVSSTEVSYKMKKSKNYNFLESSNRKGGCTGHVGRTE